MTRTSLPPVLDQWMSWGRNETTNHFITSFFFQNEVFVSSNLFLFKRSICASRALYHEAFCVIIYESQ
jgi:hypothetical protein